MLIMKKPKERKNYILQAIIQEHIKTGAPVSSGVIVEKYGLGVSSATVRNDMAELEAEGYIAQPHTSAGRVPTEKAYQQYVQKIKPAPLTAAEKKAFQQLLKKGGNDFYYLKQAAKELARRTRQAIFWAFHKHNIYYTGISNLWQQPEFSRLPAVYNISTIIDRVDEIIEFIYDELSMGTSILLGANNPFGGFCGTILSKYKHNNTTGLIGILGPMRMNYEKNLGLVIFISQRLSPNKNANKG